MFGLPIAEVSSTVRDAPITWLGDLVATVGLLSLIFTLVATRSFGFLPGAVGAYVAGAYYFTSSTGVANPAVSIGRIFTDTFSGKSAAIFILVQTNRRRPRPPSPTASWQPHTVWGEPFSPGRLWPSGHGEVVERHTAQRRWLF